MNYFEAKKIFLRFLKNNFRSFKIKERLSEFAHTFAVVADGSEYVIKLIEYRNIVSNVLHTTQHIEDIISASKKINNCKNIGTISVARFLPGKKYSILLIKKEKILKLTIKRVSDFENLGKAILSFHSSANFIKLQKLSWNNFPPHFVFALKGHNRWQTVRKFLDKNKKIIDTKDIAICHNDIHDGNIYKSGKKIIFLDIDDMSENSCYSDLGMAIANFTNSSYSKKQLSKAVELILAGYNKKNSINNIINTASFALRKLYFTEAYFFYSHSINGRSLKFIDELRKRQDMLNLFMKDYL